MIKTSRFFGRRFKKLAPTMLRKGKTKFKWATCVCRKKSNMQRTDRTREKRIVSTFEFQRSSAEQPSRVKPSISLEGKRPIEVGKASVIQKHQTNTQVRWEKSKKTPNGRVERKSREKPRFHRGKKEQRILERCVPRDSSSREIRPLSTEERKRGF